MRFCYIKYAFYEENNNTNTVRAGIQQNAILPYILCISPFIKVYTIKQNSVSTLHTALYNKYKFKFA